jgi:hypothetical protein
VISQSVTESIGRTARLANIRWPVFIEEQVHAPCSAEIADLELRQKLVAISKHLKRLTSRGRPIDRFPLPEQAMRAYEVFRSTLCTTHAQTLMQIWAQAIRRRMVLAARKPFR